MGGIFIHEDWDVIPEEELSQEDIILDWLMRSSSGVGNTLTALEALRKPFKCLRLSARIHNLRRQGHAILTTRVRVGGKHVARYSMGENSEDSI